MNIKVPQGLFFLLWSEITFYLRPVKYMFQLNLSVVQSLFRDLSQIIFLRPAVFMTRGCVL